MWPDWVSNPRPLTYESGVLPTALHGPADLYSELTSIIFENFLKCSKNVVFPLPIFPSIQT